MRFLKPVTKGKVWRCAYESSYWVKFDSTLVSAGIMHCVFSCIERVFSFLTFWFTLMSNSVFSSLKKSKRILIGQFIPTPHHSLVWLNNLLIHYVLLILTTAPYTKGWRKAYSEVIILFFLLFYGNGFGNQSDQSICWGQMLKKNDYVPWL